MKTKLSLLAIISLAAISAPGLFAGTPEQEKAFLDKYKTAFEAGDKATLQTFLYTKDAHPMALEFYKMMQLDGAGGKISKIELVDLAPADAKRAEATEEGPDGKKTRLPLKPTKKLNITVAKDGSSSSTGCLVAEKDGKFVIPVPVPAK